MPGRILIVDDAPVNLKVLSSFLGGDGHQLFTAASGDEALELARRESPDLILLDVMMPGKDGFTVCSELKADAATAEIPVVFLTALSDAADKVKGLGLGAVDYVTKPFEKGEVLARVNTHLRLFELMRSLRRMNRELEEKQRLLKEDLSAAADIQRALLPRPGLALPGVALAWRFEPCATVGGDIFNALVLDERARGFFILDVSGHGVPAAMVTVSAAQSLSPSAGLVTRPPDSIVRQAVAPAAVLAELDREYPFERFERYFTISYLVLDVSSGALRFSSAGHPPPLLLRRDGSLQELSAGGPIIGVGSGAEVFEEGEERLEPGDRVFLYTDGIPEYEDASGRVLGATRLRELLREAKGLELEAACERVTRAVREFGDSCPPRDDLSLLAFEYVGSS
jgi:sigma-B regulation protein RsbU (phosphoserine phosphatase)